jgi:hypothetical protein
MAEVYRAIDDPLATVVVVKENRFVSPEAERQFHREARLLAALRHPNLPRVTDHFSIEGQGQYLVMDFIAGEDLRTRLERMGGAQPEAEVLRWAKGILSALSYMHSRQPPVIHRDIKPGNIKIASDGTAFLVDFGLAKEYDPTVSTTLGARAYTPGFAPPEQYGQGRTDVRTDIYSLGATLYTVLAGALPSDGLERAMGNERLVPLRDLNPSVSPHVAAAIEKALSILPQDRFANSEEFTEALERPIDLAPSTPTLVGGGPATLLAPATAPGMLRRVLPWLLAGGAGLVIVLGGLALAFGLGVFPPPGETETPTPTQGPATATTAAAFAEVTATATETPAPTPTPGPTPRGGGGGQIAFVSDRTGRPQIFLIGVDGSGETQLTTLPDGACQPAWSPDGQSLLFVSPCKEKEVLYPGASIYLLSMVDGSVRRHIDVLGGAFSPDWSESGIAFTHLELNQPRVWVARSDGNSPHQISQPNALDSHPSWSADGNRLVLVNTSRGDRPTLLWVFEDGSWPGAVPDPASRSQIVSSPDWSPRGALIAYAVEQQVWIVAWDAKGYGAQQLTVVGPNDDPDFSPDGGWITFESWREGANHEIYIMTSDGSQQTRLTTDSGLDYQPAWRQ